MYFNPDTLTTDCTGNNSCLSVCECVKLSIKQIYCLIFTIIFSPQDGNCINKNIKM